MNWIEYASNPINQNTLMTLNLELTKKKRHKPMRILIQEIPELLQTLKPCWMMSPLSVSQMVDSKNLLVNFDLVIFDEASQIRTEDAICSIYRGKQLILAGDSNQLPPTNFFNNLEESTDIDDYENHHYESVLDECSAFLKTRTLNWHYRSKHESLIRFSNHHIYDAKLITFPSAIDLDSNLGVHF
jgi:superfamily I DNA and/or RNA helicase